MNPNFLHKKPGEFADPKTKPLQNLIEKDARITGLAIEHDGVFIYTHPSSWVNEYGSRTFRAKTEAKAVKLFNGTVRSWRVYKKQYQKEFKKTHSEDDNIFECSDFCMPSEPFDEYSWELKDEDFFPPTRSEFELIRTYLPKSERSDFKNASEAGKRDWLDARGYAHGCPQELPVHAILLKLAQDEKVMHEQKNEQQRSDKRSSLFAYAFIFSLGAAIYYFGT